MSNFFTGDGIDNFRFTYEQGLVEDLKILPPPVFSFNEWALPYEYKQNPAIVKVLVQGQDVSGIDGICGQTLTD